MVFWEVGFIGTLFGILALIQLRSSLSKISKLLRVPLSFILIAALVYIVYVTITLVLGIFGTRVNDKMWMIVIFLYFIAGITWTYGTFGFMKTLRGEIK